MITLYPPGSGEVDAVSFLKSVSYSGVWVLGHFLVHLSTVEDVRDRKAGIIRVRLVTCPGDSEHELFGKD